MLIDKGNHSITGEPSWGLKELNENNKTERFISELHENFIEFEEEIKSI